MKNRISFMAGITIVAFMAMVLIIAFIDNALWEDEYLSYKEICIPQPIQYCEKPEEEPMVIEVVKDITEYTTAELEAELKRRDPSEISADDFFLLERVVQAEAGTEPLIGKVAVAATILNRAECRDMTISEVVYEENQYASPFDGIIKAETRQAVQMAIDNRDLFPANMVYFKRDAYHEKYGKPYVKIGKHCFSIEPKYAKEDSDEQG